MITNKACKGTQFLVFNNFLVSLESGRVKYLQVYLTEGRYVQHNAMSKKSIASLKEYEADSSKSYCGWSHFVQRK